MLDTALDGPKNIVYCWLFLFQGIPWHYLKRQWLQNHLWIYEFETLFDHLL